MIKQPYLDRFWSYVDKNGPIHPVHGQCWIWITARNGYGQMRLPGRISRSHRISWEIHNGKILRGLHVCHKCDNPACVNPDHLFIGTMSDNIKDMWSKQRQKLSTSSGSKNGNSKLTEREVLRIRSLRKRLKEKELARMFGVSRRTIERITLGYSWKQLL